MSRSPARLPKLSTSPRHKSSLLLYCSICDTEYSTSFDSIEYRALSNLKLRVGWTGYCCGCYLYGIFRAPLARDNSCILICAICLNKSLINQPSDFVQCETMRYAVIRAFVWIVLPSVVTKIHVPRKCTVMMDALVQFSAISARRILVYRERISTKLCGWIYMEGHAFCVDLDGTHVWTLFCAVNGNQDPWIHPLSRWDMPST